MTPSEFKSHISAVVNLPDRVIQASTSLPHIHRMAWWDSDKSIKVEGNYATDIWQVEIHSRQDDCGLDVTVTRRSTDFTTAYRAALQGHVVAVGDALDEVQTFYQGLIERTKAELEAIK